MATSRKQGDGQTSKPLSSYAEQSGVTTEEGARNLLAESEKYWPESSSDDSETDSRSSPFAKKATTASNSESQSAPQLPVEFTTSWLAQLNDRMEQARYTINGILSPLAESAENRRNERKEILARVGELSKASLTAKAKHDLLAVECNKLTQSMAVERQDHATLVAALAESEKKTKELLDASDTLGTPVVERDSKLEKAMDAHKDVRYWLEQRTKAVRIDWTFSEATIKRLGREIEKLEQKLEKLRAQKLVDMAREALSLM